MVLVLVLTTVAALAGWYYTEGRFTTAPPLQSLSRSQAETVAAGAGLDIEFEREFSETVPRDEIITTSPPAGERLIAGGTVKAWVSSGPERHRVPKVVGLRRAAAEEAVSEANLELGPVGTRFSEQVPEGTVLSSKPAAGAALKRGTAVGLTVSAGPRPISIISYQGKDADDAEKALEKAGFKVAETTKHSATVPTGQVISQQPASGTGHAGDTIAVETSLGPVMVPVPNVTSVGVKDATRAMKAAGFRVRTRPVSVNYLGLGYVAYTKPGARSKAPEGSTITLYLV